MKTKCPFCNFEKLTDWYYFRHDFDGSKIVVCKDLNNRQYKYRILAVRTSDVGHRPMSRYSWDEQSEIETIAYAIANAHVKSGLADRVILKDTKHMKYPDHYHVQVCLR